LLLRQTYDYLRKLYPDFSSTKHLDIEYARAKLLPPGAPRKRLLNLLADLHQLLKDFLVWQQVKANEFAYDFALLEQYKSRKMDKAFFQFADRLIQKYEGQQENSIWSYLQLMMLYRNKFFHPNSPKLNPDDPLPQKSLALLNQFYQGARIRLATELLSREKILHSPGVSNAIDEVRTAFPPDESPLIHLYTQVYQLEKEQSEEVFFALKERFFSVVAEQELSFDDQYFVFLHLINFASAQIKKGKQNFLEEAFSIYHFGLQYPILEQGQYFTPTNFSNIVNLACRLKQFEWARYFIKTYQQHLPLEVRESAARISFAMIHFEEGNFEQTLEELQDISYADTFYDLRARSLRLRCFIELEESAALILHYCRSFEQFIRRNKKIKGDNAQATTNFIQLSKELARQRSTRVQLQQMLATKQPIFFKSWLSKKILAYKEIV
ncbi:MAG: hypothetical protein KTR30_19965, partial [Saprospiraceae bacterium]|nr:hypothetical protein [Saprospiraceae bacterium]